MKSTKSFPGRHRGSWALALVLGFAALGIAARDVEQSVRRQTLECERASRLQQLVWHRQQSAAVAPDSLTGLVRLFGTIADELAASGGDDENAAARERVVQIDAHRSACRGRTQPG